MIFIVVTRKDVAEKAKVSTATVSHVINGTKYVSDELKQRVEKAIEELDYKPNYIAKSLSTKKTKQVAIIINDITNPYYSNMILGFEEEARKRNYIVNICIGNNYLNDYFDELYVRQIDGIFLATTINKVSEERDKLNKLLDNGTALVTAMNNSFKGRCSMLDINYDQGMKEIFQHLIDLGHRKIGYIGYSNPEAELDNYRYICYRSCLEKYDLEFNLDYQVFGESAIFDSGYNEGYKYMKKLLKRETDISAVIVVNDYMAVGAMDALYNSGYKVPDDLSLVCFDNTIFSKVSRPKLTSVNVDQKFLGVKAMELIDRMLIKDENKLKIEVSTKLVVRESTASI